MRRLEFLRTGPIWLLSLLLTFILMGDALAFGRGSIPPAHSSTVINNGSLLTLAQMRGKPVAKPAYNPKLIASPHTQQPKFRSLRPLNPQMSKRQLRIPRVNLPNSGRNSSTISGRANNRQDLLSRSQGTRRILLQQGHVTNRNVSIRFTIKPKKAGAGLLRAANPPRVVLAAIAGAGRRAAQPPHLAANGINAKPRAANDNRWAGVRREGNKTPRDAGVRRSGNGGGSNNFAEKVRVAAAGTNVTIAITTRQIIGGTGKSAAEAALKNRIVGAEFAKLNARLNQRTNAVNSNLSGFAARMSMSRRIISSGWSPTKRPDSFIGVVSSANAMIAMRYSRNGVVTVTDIKRGRLPHGTAGLLMSKAMRENGINKPKKIIIQNIIEKRSREDYNSGKRPGNTALARTARLAIKDMGLKAGEVSWGQDRNGNLQIHIEVR